eukprot:TRINITY_DN10569_c0_g1_i2.p1 TRINITY_DN10569_c0_g1~~TRINITY_DN10569_c0_g1_i2.p1  ORF type:complete len:188 (+),score=74.06 TRINITY_DN10569_c0_g1_i2:2-565(+)
MKGGSRMEGKGEATPQLWTPVPRNRATGFVKEYKEVMVRMINELTTVLIKRFPYDCGGKPAFDAYSALLAMSVALDDLSMPRPDVLNTEFTVAAYHANSRKSFMQLVKRGGVYLTADLIDTLRGEDIKLQPTRGKRTPQEDETFFFQLLLTLESMDRRIDRVEEDTAGGRDVLLPTAADVGVDGQED